MAANSGDILLVDDDPGLLRLLSIRLNAAGYDVRAVKNGETALEAVETQRPDLVITDLRMGVDPFYIFSFRVAKWIGDRLEPTVGSQLPPPPRDLEIARRSWQRILDPNVGVVPETLRAGP